MPEIVIVLKTYLREDTKIYLDNLETQYVTTTQLSNISGSSSYLQSQINTKMNMTDTFQQSRLIAY